MSDFSIHQVALMDPLAVPTFVVICNKHKQKFSFHVSGLELLDVKNPRSLVTQTALKAVAQCTGCIEEAKPVPESKWPEGAEL